MDKRTLIVGLGKTGLSCARFLAPRGVPLAVTDSRAQPPGLDVLRDEFPDVALYAGGLSSDAFLAAEQLVVSPGVSLREPAIAAAMRRGVPVLGDIELFARHVRSPVVAITGTNGKSTVTSLVGDMARAAGRRVRVGGNLGTPALELMLTADQEGIEPDLYVLELSSFQLETTSSLNAVAAVVLNLSPDHLDRYASVDEYAAAKRRIYQGDGVMVINADDTVVSAMAQPRRKVVRFSLGEPKDGDFGLRQTDEGAWLAKGREYWLPQAELRIIGRHNVANALAALALGDVIGLRREVMVATLRRFSGLPHRCQWVAEHGGVAWYNDSKATNVGATAASVRGMPGNLVLIAGGDGKGADFSPLRDVLAGTVRAVVLMGRDAPQIEAVVGDLVTAVVVSDMRHAVREAARLAQVGDSVLLSPACASFDMFANFEERGSAFVEAVRELSA